VYFKYWNYTSCIHADKLNVIEQEVKRLLEQEEGCHHIPQPPQPTSSSEQMRIYPEDTVRALWIVGLFSGKSGWTIVKTWPYELLCQRAKGASRPRLSNLAIQLGCDAFHIRVSTAVNILLEADATGRTFISGWSGFEGPDRCNKFYDEQITQSGGIPQFYLLQVPEPMQAAMQVNEDPEWRRRTAEVMRRLQEGVDFELFPNWYDDDEFSKSYMHRIEDALVKVVGGSHNCWYLSSLPYLVYAEPLRLEAVGARLLYFQPPTTYSPDRDNLAHKTQPEIDSGLDTGVDEDVF
jgi:hypothetical protein